ncbi:MAG: quinone-dependent dihydroorotate dehydrogenase [Kofleriaceae bacterium]
MIYRALFWLVLRRLSAETAHRIGFGLLRAMMAVPGARWLWRRVTCARDPALRLTVFGREVASPLGLAAGFDKDGKGPAALAALGFGFVELGTITAQPQPGNPRPRMFRLPADRALVNRLGFNNGGAEVAAARLARRPAGVALLGLNIGKTKIVDEAGALADYARSAELLAGAADYLVVNVSSPNTPGLRDLQAVDKLRPLLAHVRATLDRAAPTRRVPLVVKIAPDLADADIDAVADLALELGLDGIIATNTTIGRDGLTTPAAEVQALGAGGLSGAPLAARSLAVLARLRARVGPRLVLISVGGIESADDAWARIVAGATLVQGYTGFVYGGPLWPRRIHRGLSRRLRAEGLPRLADAIGRAAR